MRKRVGVTTICGATLFLSLLLLAPRLVRSQESRAPKGDAHANADVLPALLIEVRQMRLALEALHADALLGHRAQISVQRLAVQERRLSALSQQLAEVQLHIGKIAKESAEGASQLDMIDSEVTREQEPARRTLLVAQQANVRAELKERAALEQELRRREAEVAQTLGLEQATWTDLNGKLEVLERDVGRRPPVPR